MDETKAAPHALVIVYSDGSLETAPGLTVGQALQCLDVARATILGVEIRMAGPAVNRWEPAQAAS